MIPAVSLLDRRLAMRAALLDAIAAAAPRRGATALHLLGSLGRQTADALSDVDVWLTFPDDVIDAVLRDRHDLYREVGDLLLTHEATGNRPLGGVYALALYQTPAGPMQVDWYLAPQRTSRVVPQAAVVFERVAVPRGAWRLDTAAQQEEALAERVSWLTCMLFVAIKVIVRGEQLDVLGFLARAYRDVQETHRLDGLAITEPTSLPDVGMMLRQLAPYADGQQHRAIRAVDAFQGALQFRL